MLESPISYTWRVLPVFTGYTGLLLAVQYGARQKSSAPFGGAYAVLLSTEDAMDQHSCTACPQSFFVGLEKVVATFRYTGGQIRTGYWIVGNTKFSYPVIWHRQRL